jgi:Zn-dependent peptidase ImmA (M78 family)
MGTGRIPAEALSDTPAEIVDILANVFAGALLIPSELLRDEVQKLDMSFDMIRQLSEVFWVSRSLMNQRLRDFLENGN